MFILRALEKKFYSFCLRNKKQFIFHKKTQSVYMDKNSLESGIQWVLTRWSRYFGFVYSKDFTFQTFFYQLKVEVLIFCYQMVLIFCYFRLRSFDLTESILWKMLKVYTTLGCLTSFAWHVSDSSNFI